jgi:hypothetical protein
MNPRCKAALKKLHTYIWRKIMAELTVTLVLPSGGTRQAEVPDDVQVKELIPELTTSLELPTVGPDGRPMGYRLDSKALGRELQEEETLAEAGVPEDDQLVMTADVTAG